MNRYRVSRASYRHQYALRNHYASRGRYTSGRHYTSRRYVARETSRTDRATARSRVNSISVAASGSSSSLVSVARRYMGTNPTGRSSLWCARFMNFVLQRTGHRGTGSDMARSFVSYGRRVRGPQVGAIAVLSRGRGGGHVGIVTGVDGRGNPIIISGNHGRRVGEGTYSRSRVLAYVRP